MRALLLLLTLHGCRCRSPGSGPHFEDAGALRHAAYAGDAEAVRNLAAAMDDGGAGGDEAASARLHAALGFLIVAEDDAERGAGLAALARRCGACHAAVGFAARAPSPQVGSCADGLRADRLWWELVAADAASAAETLPGEGDALDRAEAAFGTLAGGCGRCHAAGGVATPL